jgi:hypothetical protein
VKNAGRLGFVLWIETSALLAVVGVFGPWITVHGSSIPGTSAGSRGWLVLSAAFVAAAVFWFRSWTRSAGVYVALAGVVAVAAVSYDRSHLANVLGGNSVVAEHVGAGWGLDLAFAGAVSVTIAGVAWVLSRTDLPWAWLEPATGEELEPSAVDLAASENEQTS